MADESYSRYYSSGPSATKEFRNFLGRQDRLMAAIRQVIFEGSKDADRTFVYVAFKEGQILISNDETDIVFGPDWEGRQSPRRDRLLRETRRLRPQGANILTSQEAYAQIQGP